MIISCEPDSNSLDCIPPIVDHCFLDDEVDTIANRQPEITIPIYDPEPSSGINEDSIILEIDNDTLNHEWFPTESAVYYDFERGDTLALGLHELSLTVSDNTNNCTDAKGYFYIIEVDDDGPQFPNTE